jgi:hypothetical protein
MSDKGNCSAAFLAFPIKNNTLGDGVALNRGLYVQLGGQPQGEERPLTYQILKTAPHTSTGLRLTFLWENTAIENGQDCLGATNSASNITACVGRSGGAFYIDKSTTWRAAPDGVWNGTVPDPAEHDGHTLLGWDTAVFSGNVQVPGMPLAVWSDNTPLNRTALGLGSNSSTIRAFVQAGVLPELPQQIGIFMGSRSELQSVDGEIVFGGYDMSRVNGSFVWFPIGKRFAGLECPLQVLLDDVILTNTNGSQSLMPDPFSKVPACLDPIQNSFTFSPALYQKWSTLTQHPDKQPTDGSPPYTDQTYPWENEKLIEELTVKMSNDNGDNHTSTMPHYEMVSHERGSDAQGKYAVINATRAMAAVSSPVFGIMGVPLLGGTFLSQNYLLIDYERGEFGLAPANLGSMNSSQRQVACPARKSTPENRNPTVTALAVVVALGLVTIIFLLFLLFRPWRWRTKAISQVDSPPDHEVQRPSIDDGIELHPRGAGHEHPGDHEGLNGRVIRDRQLAVEVDGIRDCVEVEDSGPTTKVAEMSSEQPGGNNSQRRSTAIRSVEI